MTTTKTIADYRISWTADHEQYFQEHGIADQDHYTHCAVGSGKTLREAFHGAFADLIEQGVLSVTDLENNHSDLVEYVPTIETDMLADLIGQVKGPEMLDWDIVKDCCDFQGEHDDPDCSVCAGDWHYYVMVDLKVTESEGLK